jgi:hypothetical protein
MKHYSRRIQHQYGRPIIGRSVLPSRPKFPRSPKLPRRSNEHRTLTQKVINDPYVRTAARIAFNAVIVHTGLKPLADLVQAAVAGYREFRKTGSLRAGIRVGLNSFAKQEISSTVDSTIGSTIKVPETYTPLGIAERKAKEFSDLPRRRREKII